MKRIIPFIICLIVPVFLASCGDDDGGGIDTNLFGDWTLVRTVLRDCANTNDNGTFNRLCDDQTCETLVITDDQRYTRTITVRGQAEVEIGQIQIGETQVRLLPDNSTAQTIFGYAVTASSLTLTNETVICNEDFVYNK